MYYSDEKLDVNEMSPTNTTSTHLHYQKRPKVSPETRDRVPTRQDLN